MKVIITGATGMVGKGVLLVCLEDDRITEVMLVNRNAIGMEHPKLKEQLLKDFSKAGELSIAWQDYDAIFFCMGVSAAGMKEADYHHMTYDFTMAFAETYQKARPDGKFFYVSGTGTDSSEKGRAMWARVKGKTENAVLRLFPNNAIMFRPGAIRPLRGIKSRTKLYRVILVIMKPLWPLFMALFGNRITDTDRIGQAMINSLFRPIAQIHLENPEINQLAIPSN